jgi:hypothetical protein
LEVLEIESECLEVGCVAYSWSDLLWESTNIVGSTVGAGLMKGAMFRSNKSQRRQIEDLSSLSFCSRYLRKRVMAVVALCRSMENEGIEVLGEEESFAVVSFLPSGLASGLLSKGDGFLLVTIARGRFATVVAVFAQAVFELFDPCSESRDLFLKRMDKRENSIGTLVIGKLELFTG